MVIYGTCRLTSRSQAYGLLALAAGEHWGLSPLPALARQAGGKPYFPDAADYSFNLSHSGHLALCALDCAPVGVDIQMVKAWRPALVRRVCSSRELDWLGPEDRETYWSRFTQLWALKECRVKHSGAGLRQPIAQIQVPLPEGAQGLYRLDGLWFRLYSGEGWQGAVCGLGPPPEEIRWVAPPFPVQPRPG